MAFFSLENLWKALQSDISNLNIPTVQHDQDLFSLDLQQEKNKANHHTDLFLEDQLIVRRGQPFYLTLIPQSVRDAKHLLQEARLIAQTGLSSETAVSMALTGETQDSGWTVSASVTGKGVSLTVCPAANAPIGKYTLVLSEANHKTTLGKFVLLFNPWCPEDDVFMEKKEEIEEYVMCQDGLMFGGQATNIQKWPWNFGQFESGILKASLKILDRSIQHKDNPNKDCCKRSDPIYVTRVLSAMINSNDDSGVLCGRWDDDYSGGVAPLSWTGSVEILRQWSDSNCHPVRYGQCWVFAGLGCTVARALGIPCRVITNFESAHDTNGDLKIENFINEDGELEKEHVWNFHCWVESWMKRPDLKPGYDGWQASDPTPQEQSEGLMCCGPVPVKAIKLGDLNCKYDAAFVYAEVNADLVTKWRPGYSHLGNVVNTVCVGQFISTKSIGKDKREDITHLYKYTEGSKLEREAYRNAQVCQNFNLTFEDHGEIVKGSDFVLYVLVTNKSYAVKKIKLRVSSRKVLHNGNLDKGTIQSYDGKHSLQPGEELRIPLEHQYSRYSSLLSTGSQLQVNALLTDVETMNNMLEKHTITLEDPEINIQIVGQPRVGQQCCAKLSVKNLLPEQLSECWFLVQGANLTNSQILTQRIISLCPGEVARAKMYFTPTQSGPRKLMVNFYNKKLGYIKSYTNLNVSK